MNRMKVVIEPDRLIATLISRVSSAGHCFVGFHGIVDPCQVHCPTLRKLNTILHGYPFLFWQKTSAMNVVSVGRRSFCSLFLNTGIDIWMSCCQDISTVVKTSTWCDAFSFQLN